MNPLISILSVSWEATGRLLKALFESLRGVFDFLEMLNFIGDTFSLPVFIGCGIFHILKLIGSFFSR